MRAKSRTSNPAASGNGAITAPFHVVSSQRAVSEDDR